MSIKILSFSADVPSLKNNKLFNSDDAVRYPGSSWVTHIKKLLPHSLEFQTADFTLKLVESGKVDPKSVAVIQHNLDIECAKLINLGALPFLLTMYESPLYAGRFYDCLDGKSKIFLNRMVFGAKSINKPNTVQAYFPSFSNEQILSDYCESDWSKRKFSCMVVANKYVLTKSIFCMRGFGDIFWWIAKFLRRHISGLYLTKTIDLQRYQLQDKRLEVIQCMLKFALLDLYGGGWEKLYRIPPSIKNQLHIFIPKVGVPEVSYEKKRKLLEQYKFNICFENMSYPGYVTEKIIDAILAGTIPVYWGAPDISDYVPEDVFIDASRFSDFEEMVNHLLNMDEQCAERMLQKGREFLVSPAGQRFSYESIASEVIEMLRPYVR